MARLEADGEISARVVVTGSHLCRALGYTASEIAEAGFSAAAEIDILLGDPAAATDAAMSRALLGFSDYFRSTPPELVVVLGDRYEIFAAVTAAAVNGLPVAHISGGETTEGANDEFFRHCITKMSSLHFTSTEVYRRRVIQLGESPDRVFNAGSLGAENICALVPIGARELSEDIGFDVTRPFLLCTCHPETLGGAPPLEGLTGLLAAIEELGLRCLFTAANADEGGAAINERIEAFCAGRDSARLVKSLGTRRYLSAMRLCAAVAGNSSSAIVEAPTLHRPAVNIGDRQKGRIMGGNTICCGADAASIRDALKKAMSPGFAALVRDMPSPYGNGDASAAILRGIKAALKAGIPAKKAFYDIDFEVGS
jgi:GDP/UDP-N,N'-diacetylbacillosamine 2-epimerase (hydrolysing)